MILLRKNNQTQEQEEISIRTDFKADLKTFELLKFCNILFRFSQALPEGQNIYWRVKEHSPSDSPIAKQDFNLEPTVPTLEDLKDIVKKALSIIEMSHNQIILLLSFARTQDNMLLSEQIEVLTPSHIAFALEKIILDFIDVICEDSAPPSVSLEKVRNTLIENIKNGYTLDFKEVLLVASIKE